MTQSITRSLNKAAIISALSISLAISSPVQADHNRDILLLAAPIVLYNLLKDHSYTRHTRIQRHHHGHNHYNRHHHKPRKHSHSRGHYTNDRRKHRRH